MSPREPVDRTLSARWLVCEPGHVLENASLQLDRGRVGAVHAPRAQPMPSSRPPRLIIPGLINAHVHLDLTNLARASLPRGPFVSWVKALMSVRGPWGREDLERSIRQGIELSLASGVTAVGDIDGTGAVGRWVSDRRPGGIAFLESVGFPTGEAAARVDEARRVLETEPPAPLARGLSPHAPYSCSAALYRGLHALAARTGRRMATHVAETPEELELLACGTGPFRDLLESLGKMPADWRAPGQTSIEYLESLGVLCPELLLVHANHLSSSDIERIAAAGSTVVYCPRSHAFFGHQAHPWRQLLAAGIPVALGTDSLASNESLSMLDEMRFLVGHIGCPPHLAFELATRGGASALGRSDLGLLKPGVPADFVVLELADDVPEPQEIYRALLDPRTRVAETWVGGRLVWRGSEPDLDDDGEGLG